MKRIGQRLKEFRHAAGLTQFGLAEASGVSRQTIAKIEIGYYRTARVETLERLARALKVPIAFLLAEMAPERKRSESKRTA